VTETTQLRADLRAKIAGEVVSRAVNVLCFFYVARALGAESFGELSLALSVGLLGGFLLLDPGLNTAMVRHMIREPAGADLRAGVTLALKVLLAVPMFGLLAAAAALLDPWLPRLQLVILAGCYALALALLDWVCAITNAFSRMDLEAWIRIGSRLGMVGAAVVADGTRSTELVLAAMAAVTIAAAVGGWLTVARHCLRATPRWHGEEARKALAEGWPIAGASWLTGVYQRWDLLFLSAFSVPYQAQGWYAAAFRILEMLCAAPVILGAAAFPTLVRLHQRDPRGFEELLLLGFKCAVTAAAGAAFMTGAFSAGILSFLYGPGYRGGAATLEILAWSAAPLFVHLFLLQVNVARGRAEVNVWCGAAALVAGLLANLLLIPRAGIVGAAWGSLAAHATFALLAMAALRPAGTVSRVYRAALGTALAGGAAGWLAQTGPLPAGGRLALSIVVYTALLVAGRVFTIEEARQAARLWRGREAYQRASMAG
jgi:O-antigen/teichoic acid export membrane protein